MRYYLVFVLLLAASQSCIAKDDHPAYTTADQGGIAFQIQGEYAGDIDGDPWGAQVIALGDDKFRVVGYQGGLPGDGWSRGDETRGGEGELDGDQAVFELDEVTLTVDGKTLEIESDGGNLASLKKVNRKSPTLGAKPPEGAIVCLMAVPLMLGKMARSPKTKTWRRRESSPKQPLATIHCIWNSVHPLCQSLVDRLEETAACMFTAAMKFKSWIPSA